MTRYIIKRILLLIPVVLGVMLVVFIFQAISPADPVLNMLGSTATQEDIDAMTVKLGLDKPILVQYLQYVYNFFFHLDLGTSYISHQPVMYEIMVRWPYTLVLAVGSVLLGVLLGIPLGILSAVKQYTWTDNVILGFSVLLASFPSFWLALLMIVLFSVKLGWLPSTGIESFKGWIMPVIVVTLVAMSNLIRTTRASMLETLRQDFVDTARSKGQKERAVIFRHVVRNSMIPVVNGVGLTIGVQLGGALVIENVFGIPGIGSYVVYAINNLDYPAVCGCVVMLALVFSVINLLCDLIYTLIDPRLKVSFAAEAEAKKRMRQARRQLAGEQKAGNIS